MARNYYDEDDIDSSYENENIQNNINDSEDYDSDYEDDINSPSNNPIGDATNDYKNDTKIVEYNILSIGITNLIVSTNGIIRKTNDLFSSSAGYALPGTPYRTYVVEVEKDRYEEYYVHDIVWRAFYGDPPEGWEVRHTFWEAKNKNEFYDNSLESLQIYPSTVVHMPSRNKLLSVAD